MQPILRFALASFALPCLSFASTTFSDSTFNTANYTNPFTFATATSGAFSISSSQCTSCGNPGNALQSVVGLNTPTSASGQLDAGYLNTAFLYTPSAQGDLASIDVSVDNSTEDVFGLGVFNSFYPLISQDGNFYYATISSGPVHTTAFATESATLLAIQFKQFNPATGATNASSHPDFSGDQMDFGLMVVGGSIALPTFRQTIIYDNLSINLVAVPEPTTFLLLGAALAGLGIARRAIRGEGRSWGRL